ncbi:MAG: hypothetical protein ABSA47_06010 [Verrucomicrobiota bacterium]|jgi:hypothetical protein
MKIRSLVFSLLLGGLAAISSQAQSLVGTNSPGQTTNYPFTLGAGATNLSLVVSNNASAYSWLFLTNGAVAPTINNYEFTSRLPGQTNQINLEPPEFATGSYNLLVYTPPASTSQAFSVALTTNRGDLRGANYPVSKPLAFSTTGHLTNSGAGAWQYFQVDVPSNLLTGWRIVVSSTNATPPWLYIRQGQVPTTSSYDVISGGTSIDTVTYDSPQAVAGTYFIGVYLPAGTASWANYVLGAELASVTTLTWDPGTTQAGTQVFSNQSTTGGDYFFAITTETTACGVWRNALNVQSGQAGLYLLQGTLPTTNSSSYASAQAGSNGFVLAQSQQFNPGQNWYILVHATPGAQWNLVTGEAYVQQLPALATDSSSGATVTMGAEGMAFFKTTIPIGTLAWRLGLDGLGNPLYVKSTLAPVPLSTSTYDLTQAGQMLVVPTYLSAGNQYFVGVAGNPGLLLTLDSRQQAVTPVAFDSTTPVTVSATAYGYVTFQVQVPVHQIAWEVDALPTLGSASVAVRSNNVPNEFVNSAVSDISGGVGNSVSLVPPTLTDGSFYVTVYGTPPYNCSFVNGQPVITPVDYVFAITNDAPYRVGWRYYTITNVAEQLDSLGWELDLTNPPPGAEIALRRNAVPGQWNYRNNAYDSYSYSSSSYVDLSSTLDFLQQPGHPADVWYIGVYSPSAVLGSFVLAGSQLIGTPVNFDGAGSLISVTDQPAGKFQYFTYTVPPGTVGWDLRLTNVTSGWPYFFICRDELPSLNNPYYWNPPSSASWPSGYQWQAGSDWTGDYYDVGGIEAYGQILEMGMGNPLQAGTYYVGVANYSGPGPLSYTLMSRGIGPGYTIPITPLAFSNGVASVPGLAPREAAYYQMTVPNNATSWRVEMDTNIGDSLLIIQQNALPNVDADGAPPYDLDGGREMNKPGDEQYLMMPNNYAASNFVVGGTYYLAVVSQGVNPGSDTIGTGLSSFTLNSDGSVDVTNMGTVDPTGLTDLRMTNNLSLAGQMSAYSFTVPANTLSLEIFLTNTTGTPNMTLVTGSDLPEVSDGYGNNGGQSYTWTSPTLINIPNPTATNYTMMVQAEQAGGNASYTIDVQAIGAQTVAFDGGTATILNQPPDIWQFFNIIVPAGPLGWDVRLTNVTAPNDVEVQPVLYICRDMAPSLNNPYYWSPSSSAAWPSGHQWQAGADWTGDYYDPSGAEAYGRILEMGMGNPLSPGNYYLGVYNNTTATNLVSYTLVSRGIGPGYTIPVNSLTFSNGVANVPGLAPREAAYYQVTVPNNATSWRVEMDTNVGDSLLLIQQNALPNVDADGAPPYDLDGGREMNKPGDQQYLMMPNNYAASNFVVGGTYYLAVVGEGVNPSGDTIGTGLSSFTLGSYGSVDVTNMGTADPTGLTDLRMTNNLSLAGQISAYSFNVPANTLSLEVFLANTTGTPNMTLGTGSDLPTVSDSYGNNGGQSYTWTSPTLINIANPAATNYTMMAQAEEGGGNASYTIDVHAIGAQTVAFDGGTVTITNQPPDIWEYFYITVPSNTTSPFYPMPIPVLGWDLRLTNVSAPNDIGVQPVLYVCRDTAPSLNNPNYWNPPTSASWPSGYQWQAGMDWTGDYYETNGAAIYGRILEMGMGNPLSPGNYYLGVYNNTTATNLVSYTLVSRGIGPGCTIPVNPLTFSNGVAANLAGLNPRQVDYYQVTVPTNAPSWKIRLANGTGETLLMLQESALPNVDAGGQPPYVLDGGREMNQPGNEQYLLLPNYYYSNFVVAGTYYLGVVSQGVNPGSDTIGTNSSTYTLTSYGPQGITNLGTVGPVGMDIYQTNAIQGGENALYQFAIPPGMPAVEVRLDNVTASPYMTMQTGSNIVSPEGGYGYNGGANPSWSSSSLITLPNPTATNYSLTVQADYNSVANAYLDANFTVHVRQMPIPVLAFDPSLNNNNNIINTASGVLEAGQSAFYQVTVPADLGDFPVLGWVLNLTETSGSATLAVRPGALPDGGDCDGSSPLVANQGIYVAPYLTPGTWYVEVFGNTAASYTLTSQALELNRPAWTMPAVGGMVTTPGLPASGPLFADTGVSTGGITEGGDGGSDLAQGAFDYYEIIVPTTNTGVLRTRLDAISGNPNLYIRAGGPPTLSHYSSGNCGSLLYDRSLTASSGSEYGNWVPLDGRHEAYLTSGTWYLAVQAGGSSNVRYRLRMDTGNITPLALNGGSLTSQEMVAGDWLYYSAFIPTNAPVDWNVTFSTQLGNVVMYVRDRVPPGQATATYDLRDWNSDDKNHGPYPNFPSPGTHTLTTPPLRPGNTYYLGFYAENDSTFSVSDSTNGGFVNYTSTLPFYGGYTTNQIPAYGQLKFRIDVPNDATEWIDTSIYPASVWLFLDQGSAPTLTRADDWYSEGNPNQGLDVSLENATSWPWLPGYSYYLNVTNTSGATQPFSFSMFGVYPEAGPFEFTSAVLLPGSGGFQMNMQVNPGWTYQVLVSTDLINWSVLTTFTPTGTTATFTDTSAPYYSYRFYRLVPE